MYSREEMKQLKRNFWGGFDAFCENLPRFKYRKKKWILYNTKIKGIEMKFDATREGAFVILELNHPREERRLELLEILERYKVIVEENFANATWELLYEKPCGTVVSRIYKEKRGIDIHRQEDWPEFYKFMSYEMNKLEKVFNELREMLQENKEASV